MPRLKALSTLAVAACFVHTPLAHAGPADVLMATVERAGDSYFFNVTVSHADEGWDHYADRWEVLDESGAVVATRVLAHPHVNEQPFTRALNGVVLPDADLVTVRARDSKDGYGGVELQLKVTGARNCVTAFDMGLTLPDRVLAQDRLQCPERFQDR